MGNTESRRPVSTETFLERIFTDAGMGVPWAGAHSHFVVSIDIGATHSAVVVTYLKPSTSTSTKSFSETPCSSHGTLEAVPKIYRISHWPGQEAMATGHVPSVLQYSDTSEVYFVPVYCSPPPFSQTYSSTKLLAVGAEISYEMKYVRYFKLQVLALVAPGEGEDAMDIKPLLPKG